MARVTEKIYGGVDIEKQITDLEIDEVYWFKHEKQEGVVFTWNANIGFGELTIYRAIEGGKWRVDSECMCNNEDKDFIRMVLNKWVDEMVIDN